MSTTSGCGGGTGSNGTPAASVNGVALHAGDSLLDDEMLRQRAWSELLRQEAVRQRLLPDQPHERAPDLTPADQEIIGQMLERSVPVPVPTEAECRRYHEAHRLEFVHGAAAHVRHILFAVTAGVDVARLAARAEQALLELSRKDVPTGRFAELARELSNCPSGAAGGDLGWITPEDCATELANELFHDRSTSAAIGLRPRLVHSRYGFHIVEVLERKPGQQPSFEQVHGRIAVQLAGRARARALHQFMQLLAGQASIEGVVLGGAESPLVQ